MKRIPSILVKSLVTILIGSEALAVRLQAQSDVAITASIPFPFTVGKHRIAAGTYRFRQISPFQLSVLNVKTDDLEIFAVHPDSQPTFEQHGRLIFRDSAGNPVLNEVHFPGTETFSELIERRPPRRMEAKQSSTANSISIAQR